MDGLTLKKVKELLGIGSLPGSKKELGILCTRLGELAELNGEEWIRENRQNLLDEWETIIRLEIIRPKHFD